MVKPKRKKVRIVVFLLIICIPIIFFILKAVNKPKGVKVQTDKVTKGKIISKVSGSAKIQPEVQVKISAKVSGQIMELGVKEGEIVQKGQFLVQLDPEYYKAACEQAESSLKSAEASCRTAQNEYTRSQKLFADNLISQEELEIKKSNFEQAEAQVDQAKALRDQANDNLAKTKIFSPMDGIVTQLNKKAGEMAMGSQFTLDVIMIISDLHKMLAETDIDENDVVSVILGDTSSISIDAFPDTSFFGIVQEIANTGTIIGQGSSEQVTNFLVKVTMIEKPERIRPGMSATVYITTESKKDVLKVPIQCVTMRQPIEVEEKDKEKTKQSDSTHVEETTSIEKDSSRQGQESEEPPKEPIKVVFVVKEDKARQVPVTTGIISDTEWEIKEGLEEGEEIVSGSYRILSRELKDGDQVIVDNTLKKKFRSGE